jgi:hypothetical protein
LFGTGVAQLMIMHTSIAMLELACRIERGEVQANLQR